MADLAARSIDARSIVTLVIFFAVNILVLFPLHIPLPTKLEGKARCSRFTLGLATAPVIGVLLLLAATCIPGDVVRRGIVGAGHVRPYDIMTLFLSFAYISLSLDCTGLLLYLAFTVASRSPPNGRSLFSYLYALFIALALAVGNDPIVLSGTPFVAYFTSHARIVPPTAFLFAQFQAANLASALLVSSNPTNLVLTSSFGMSFLTFSAWTALPTIAAAVALYPVLLLQFRSAVPDKISPPHVVPRHALTDPTGAIFTTTIFIASIILLVALSAAGKLEGVQGVWSVTGPAAILIFLRDCVHDYTTRGTGAKAIAVDEDIQMEPVGRKSHDEEAERDKGENSQINGGRENGDKDSKLFVGDAKGKSTEPGTSLSQLSSLPVFEDDEQPHTTGVERHHVLARRRINSVKSPTKPVVMRRHGSGDSRALNIPPPVIREPQSPPSPSPSAPASRHPLAALRTAFPTVSTIVGRLPLPLLPFAFSMFILVEALDHTGWVSVWALWWERWARASGAAGCIFLMGIVSVVGCNILGTNIGVTVLLSRILMAWNEEIGPTKRALYGSILALAIGSNFGAYSFSFPASLAGLLWRDILSQKGLHVRALEFLRWNVLPLIVTMLVGGCVVGAEVCVMFKQGVH